MLSFVYALVVLALVLVTLAPLSNARHWLVRGNDFPRLQYAALLTLALGLLFVWRGEGAPSAGWAWLLVPALGYQLYWIWPYWRLHPTEVREASDRESRDRPGLSLLTSNVLMENRDSERLIAHVHALQPDLLVTLETDAWWQAQLDEALTDWPHRVAHPLDNRYGIHLYSRLPLDEAHVDFLVEDDIPSISARFQVAGIPVRFHAIHPTPPAPGENPSSMQRDVELLTLADALTDSNERIVVTGDLNDVAWSRTTRLFRQRSRLLDLRVGRGMFNTFHADYPFLRWPLDHVFVSGHFVVHELRRLGAIGSDHFPVFVDLRLLPLEEQVSQLDEEDIDRELEQQTRSSAAGRAARPPAIGTDAWAPAGVEA